FSSSMPPHTARVASTTTMAYLPAANPDRVRSGASPCPSSVRRASRGPPQKHITGVELVVIGQKNRDREQSLGGNRPDIRHPDLPSCLARGSYWQGAPPSRPKGAPRGQSPGHRPPAPPPSP